MSPGEALAAAVRARLAADAEVALPGLGTLRRTHRAARIEDDAEGHRVLLPPRETITFEPDPRLDSAF